MKLVIITDQHFGARKSSRVFHDNFQRFYDDIFFPFLEKNKIEVVLDLGDTFDNRKNVDIWAANWARNNYFNRLQKMGVEVHSLVGNHTAYYKDTNKINTLDNFLREYENVHIYENATEVEIGGLPILFIPWINSENTEDTFDLIESTDCEVAMGHLELNGFEAHKGYVMTHGTPITALKKFKQVLSGHYHKKSSQDQFHYLGNPYEIYWNDWGDDRGFHVYDTDTLEKEFIRNPYTMFSKVFYDERKLPDPKEYAGKVVKVIVENKTDSAKFEYFISQLYVHGVHEIKVVEDSSLDSELDDSLDIEKEDTLTILENYVDGMDYQDKDGIKTLLKSLYVEALEQV